MRKNLYLCLALSAALISCGQANKNETNDTTTQVEKKVEEAKPAADVFVYTNEHRAQKYVPQETRMTFSNKIESINNDEFKENKNLEEIWIGAKIKHVANNAFTGCTSLKKVHYAAPMPVINDEAFMDCSSLEDLNVDVYTIGLDGFKNCTSLKSARFGEHIYWIRSGAFANCKNLKSILMAITMEKLEDGAFEGCTSMEEFSIPNDFKNRMFGMFPNQEKFRKIYLLTTEFYPMPKSCEPNKQCTLYVPDAFVAQFQQDENWSKFGKIEPLSKTSYYTAEGFLAK